MSYEIINLLLSESPLSETDELLPGPDNVEEISLECGKVSRRAPDPEEETSCIDAALPVARSLSLHPAHDASRNAVPEESIAGPLTLQSISNWIATQIHILEEEHERYARAIPQ